VSAKPQTAEQVRQNLAEQLDWAFAERNDYAIAHALANSQPAEAVHNLTEAGLLDGFFTFLQQADVIAHWNTFKLDSIHRIFLPAICFLLLYGTRLLLGIDSTNALPSLLFSNIGLMTVIGFNAHQVIHGMTRRGTALRTGARPYCLMDPQTLAKSIAAASLSELERLFNGTIHCLAAFGVFTGDVMLAVDGTPIPTTPRFKGCGCQKMPKRKKNRQGVWVEQVDLIFGWRLIALIDLVTMIPIAITLVQIQAHEAPYLVDLVKQAQANLAPYNAIRTLVVDRAYVDGPSLYALHEMGITFVVIAKTNMVAYDTALALSGHAPLLERVETVRHGQGRAAWTEDWITRVVPVEGIRTWDTYRPSTPDGQRLPRAKRPALNAVVVKQWRNRTSSKAGPRVYVTNGPVKDPWPTVDAYDDRSWIENGLFRNHKQFSSLTQGFPEKTEAGVRSHVFLVMLVAAAATAYRLWSKAQLGNGLPPDDHQIETVAYRRLMPDTGELIDLPQPSPTCLSHLASQITPPAPDLNPGLDFLAYHLLGGQGLERWRRELQRENRDKVIVFIENQYGIFDMHDFLILSGVPLADPFRPAQSREDILRRYKHPPETTVDLHVGDT